MIHTPIHTPSHTPRHPLLPPLRIAVFALLAGLALAAGCGRSDQEPGRDLAPPGAGQGPASTPLPASGPVT